LAEHIKPNNDDISLLILQDLISGNKSTKVNSCALTRSLMPFSGPKSLALKAVLIRTLMKFTELLKGGCFRPESRIVTVPKKGDIFPEKTGS
jgi:hypothetical protein